MNKSELVNAIAEKANLKASDAAAALKAAVDAISEALEKNEKVSLIGFGTFSVAEKAARTGFNPQTKAAIEIPARKTVKFKAGADLAAKIK